ncbi:MAG: O-antigen ligase family protein [Flavobacteriia bacterium]|nr:O-antigen ligase family protein [Flavobacteriia bacterium]
MVSYQKLLIFSFLILFIIEIIGFKKKLFIIKKPSKIALLFICFYFAYLAGSFFTYFPEIALKYLEYKMAFLLIPLLFIIQPKPHIKLIFPILGIISGVLIVALISLINGIICYNKIHYYFECFFSSYLISEHPTYFTIFLTMSLASIWISYHYKYAFLNKKINILMSFFFITFIVLLLSISGILFLLLLILIYILKTLSKKYGYIKSIIISFICVSILTTSFLSISIFKNEFSNTKNSFLKYIDNPKKFIKSSKNHNGDDVRLIMWTATIQEMYEHPFGVGTGNVDYYLSKRLKSLGQLEMSKMDNKNQILYNPHNQFLQTGLEIGIFGLLVLLFILFYVLYFAYKTKNWLLLILVSNLFFNCLFESMLQRQSGIVFYTFWICLLSYYSNPKDYIQNENTFSHSILST